MGILWPQDVRTKIVTQLNDGTNGIVAQLTAIDTTRGTVTDPPKYIDPVSNDGNFPSVYVDLGDSTILTPHGTTYALARETLELQVSVIMKHSKNDILIILKQLCGVFRILIIKLRMGLSLWWQIKSAGRI